MRLPARLEAWLWQASRKGRGWWRQRRAELGAWRRQRQGQKLVVNLRGRELGRLEPPWLTHEGDGPYWLLRDGDAGPPAWEEALLMATAAWEPGLVEVGWAAPGRDPDGQIDGMSVLADGRLAAVRRSVAPAKPLKAIWLPQITDAPTGESAAPPLCRRHGLCWLDPQVEGLVDVDFAIDLDRRLAAWPTLQGPPTVLFLLPFLAVGGAERLLADLLRTWGDRYRVVIVTVEPHRRSLGQNADAFRELTPWVFTLGDWLPRAAHLGALCHLLRRLRVDTLCSWNGTIFFYDQAAELRRRFPGLRIAAQLYHHEGGFFARSSADVLDAIDVHCAVNGALVTALRKDLGVPAGAIELIHHGIEIPPLPPIEERLEAKTARRRELGLPADGIVVGTFARCHEQKRPLDAVALARRLASSGVHLLWVGGGPLEGRLRDELAARPTPNFHWKPMVADARPLFDAIDLCFLPSAYEGLPIFLLDGLARSIPCVATAVGDIPLLLTAGGGLTAGIGDLAGLEAGVRSLLDPSRREQEGRRGRKNLIRHFGLEHFARRYRQVLLPEAADG
jgi:glycosyltransferase involved in cell wall biosynthesis